MNIGHRLGLVLMYVLIAGNALLMLRIFIEILFREAIEKHRRRQFAERNGGAAYTLRGVDGKRGWAKKGLPRNPEITQRAQDGNSAGKLAGATPIVKQAIALVLIVMALGLASTGAAQQRTDRESMPSTLKKQLLDLESKETQLRMRLEELDEQLKPESIERELAGIGSTRPEELREHRRKLLTIERNGSKAQLELLEERRARIEAAIAAAATAASLEYAQPSPTPLLVNRPAKPITEMIALRDLRIGELPLQKLYVAAAMLVLLGSGFILLLIVARQKVEQWIGSMRAEAAVSKPIVIAPKDPLTPTVAPWINSTQGLFQLPAGGMAENTLAQRVCSIADLNLNKSTSTQQ